MASCKNDVKRFTCVIPNGHVVKAVRLNGKPVMVPTGTELKVTDDRHTGAVMLAHDEHGIMFMDDVFSIKRWLMPLDWFQAKLREGLRCGGTVEGAAYTQENASRPLGADRMWYEN